MPCDRKANALKIFIKINKAVVCPLHVNYYDCFIIINLISSKTILSNAFVSTAKDSTMTSYILDHMYLIKNRFLFDS